MDTDFRSKRHHLTRVIMAVMVLFTLILPMGCSKSDDKPPRLDTPLPKAHTGTYVSEDARFTFKGDGRTVLVELSDRYLDVLQDPPNGSEYTYTFTWYDFGECRYDAATDMRLYHVETKTSIGFSLYEAASFDRITISFPLPGKAPQVLDRVSDNP
ncbi:hypothetical protein [Youngiibacter fragilis]|uniref:Uncharacterized protein n=1 Tax=Youngiibacter fragilis 232.1 TaxID=994573 RepID=V7IC81_9CLOT|nr:hypothetical protein [Youngiibacter fragilis]ETA82477.1 hypothetical protein T472_0200895 [Youngiibacter fragilis 232.1]